MRFILATVICVALVFTNIGGVLATNKITVSKGSVSVVLRGSYLEPTDENGNATPPFIYDGTTYLPVRAISEALGLTVEWIEALNIISLKSHFAQTDDTAISSSSELAMREQQSILKAEAYDEEIEVTMGNTYLFLNDNEVVLQNANGEPVDIILTGGTNYLPVRAISNALGIAVTWDEATETVYLDDTTTTIIETTDETGIEVTPSPDEYEYEYDDEYYIEHGIQR